MMKRLLAAVVVVMMAVVGAVGTFGDNLKALFGMSADCLAGDTVVARRTGKLERKKLTSFAVDDGAYAAPVVSAPSPNPEVRTALDSRSTFAIDVDTASYTFARRLVLEQRALPPPGDVRVEEWVNAFDYRLAPPTAAPFAVSVEGATSPFDEARTLLKVSLKGRVVADVDRQPAHLVFLVDVSGSMAGADRLPLAKRALAVLTRQLTPRDTVALVTYAGSTEVVLPPTPVTAANRTTILRAIDALDAGGGTAMGSGMELAYRLAVRQVAPRTTTRVVVLTDGDTNIGPNLTPDAMLDAVHAHVEEGVTLTTVGFGLGNYRGNALERLADKGNGQALYVDGEAAIERVFHRQLTGTLEVIAKDAKVQVTFDPKVVSSYRLLGYENRAVADEDFRNDAVDGGELGAGHAVTALYEVTLTSQAGALGTVAVRGLVPGTGQAFEVEQPISRAAVAHALPELGADFRFAAAVALGADTLRGNELGAWPLGAIAELAEGAADERPERLEFVALLRRAAELRAGQGVALRQGAW
ncbi:MAG: vWA domain-containing protein [Myxococcota bacterium]